MKRILIALFLFGFILMSCNITTENIKNDLFDGKNVETVLLFSPDVLNDEKLRDTVSISFDDKNQETAFIKSYLQKHETFKETPDSVYYDDKNYYIEYYANNDKKKTSFIIHFIYDANTFGESVYCITFSWDDLKELGNIVYDCDQNGDTIYENLYDTNGEQIADISYEYVNGFPFPLISKYNIPNDDNYYFVYKILNRNQKFWFYKDLTVFDKTGKITRYNGDLQDSQKISQIHFNNFIYDEKNRLSEIHEEFTEEDKKFLSDDFGIEDFSSIFSGKITLGYSENGKLILLNYGYHFANHGTWESSGEIYYDEQGRMIYRDYYITHGTHYCIYLYEGESKRPWAYIELCSMPYTVQDNVGYGGAETSVYLFQSN